MRQRDKIALRRLWHDACVEEDIDPNAMFVVFSEDNVAAKRYNEHAARMADLGRDTVGVL